MGCPACRDYEWEDQQDTIAEINGEGFCIFHAPVESKGITDEEFNARVFDRLMMAAVERVQGNTKAYCNLNGVVFPGHISFAENRYFCEVGLPDVTMFKAQFHGFADFLGLKFQGEAGFNEAIFHQRVRFAGAKFQGEAGFYSVMFKGMADFRNSVFRDSAMFDNAQFLRVSKFNGVVFKSSSVFSDVLFTGKAIFSDITAANQVELKNLSPDSSRNIVFRRNDIPIFTLQTCKWADRLGLDVHGLSDSANILLDCEELYRAMKQKAADSHDQPQVSRWHFREKLMQLKQLLNNERSNNLLEEVEDPDAKWSARTKAWFKLLWHRPHWPKFTLTGIYWATSGFGERAVRAGMWLLALVVLSFVANSIKEPWVWAELPGSAAAQYTMGTIPFAKDIPGDGWVKVGRGFWQFLIAVQFTLFALAVRNRFRR